MCDPTADRHERSLEDQRSSDEKNAIPEAAERLDNNVPQEEINRRVTELVTNAGLEEYFESFRKGAWLAHDSVGFYTNGASEDEREVRNLNLNHIKGHPS